MTGKVEVPGRVFKTAWFSKVARKARISDAELCEAMTEVMKGQCVDLGGGVFKKRLNKNMHRSIIVAKGAKYWVYTYLFAKKDQSNISPDELVEFRKLATLYAAKTQADLMKEIGAGELKEICNGGEAEI